MQNAPTYDVDFKEFWLDPCPDFKRMRDDFLVAHVPQLGAVLITRRDDTFKSK